MQLLGSTTSPYVRRIRLFFRDADFEFVNMDIFSKEGAEVLEKNNPAKKVPALIDGDLNIYDSRVIYRYLSEKLKLSPLTWPQENLLTLIDAANDSLVSLLLSKRSDLDIDSDVFFFKLQHERIETIYQVLDSAVANEEFSERDYPSVCLFCLLDWVTFRTLSDLSPYRNLLAFYQRVKFNDGVSETDPR